MHNFFKSSDKLNFIITQRYFDLEQERVVLVMKARFLDDVGQKRRRIAVNDDIINAVCRCMNDDVFGELVKLLH